MVKNITGLINEFNHMKVEFTVLKSELTKMSELTVKDLNTLNKGNVLSLGNSFGFIKNKTTKLYTHYKEAQSQGPQVVIDEIDGFLSSLIKWLEGIKNADEKMLSQYFSQNPNDKNSAKYFDNTMTQLSLKISELNKRMDFAVKDDKILIDQSTQISDFSNRVISLLDKIKKSTCPNLKFKDYYSGFMYKTLISQLNTDADFVKFNVKFRTYDVFNKYFCENLLPKFSPNFDNALRDANFHSNLIQNIFVLLNKTTLNVDTSGPALFTILKQESFKIIQPMYPKFTLTKLMEDAKKNKYVVAGLNEPGIIVLDSDEDMLNFILTGYVSFNSNGKIERVDLNVLEVYDASARVEPHFAEAA